MLTVYTIGHSTHPIEVFLGLLRTHQIAQLADVRTVPRSRRHPHFEQARLAGAMEAAGIVYRHFPGLGGLRRPRPDSRNTGWRHEGFRGYADHMQSGEFKESLQEFEAFARVGRTVAMCAESVWWECHRRLLADALLVRSVPVLHILTSAAPKPHELSQFAREHEDGVIYPGLL
jgi:uncharacterized protein (DUF488 family)